MGNSAVPKIELQPEISSLLQQALETVPQKLEIFSSFLIKIKTDYTLSFFRNTEALHLFEKNPHNFRSLFLFCVDILSKEAEKNQEVEPHLVGAILALTRMTPILIEQTRSEESKVVGDTLSEELLWKTKASENGPPLIVKLVEDISVLMFKPGFTVDIDPHSNYNKRRSMTGINEKLIWKRGIRLDKVSKKQQYIYDQNRCLLVRLALVVLSEPIYQAPRERSGVSPLIALMTCKISRNSKNIFFSLINSCFNYDCDGFKIPYISAIQRHMHEEKLAELSAQLLNVLLSGKPPTSQEALEKLIKNESSHWKDIYEYFEQEIEENNREMNLKSTQQRRPSVLKSLFYPKAQNNEEAAQAQDPKEDEDQAQIPDPRQIVKPKVEQIEEQQSPAAGNVDEDVDRSSVEEEVPHIFNSHAQAQTEEDLQKWLLINEYTRILTIFESEHDFSVIINGTVKLLRNSQRVENTTLPHSVRAIHFHEEMLLLLWRMISTSSKFAFYLVTHPKFSKLISSIVFHLHKGKSNPRKANTLYMSIFILFYLSQCKPLLLLVDTFGRNLNLPYSDSVHLEDMPPVEGSLADLIIVSLCKAIQKAPASLASLHKIISGLICNVSPHVRFISAAASNSLIQMVKIFSSSPGSLQSLRTLLDAIDYNLYYQNKRNYNLILSVYQTPQVWKNLQTSPSKNQKKESSPHSTHHQELKEQELKEDQHQDKKEAWIEQSMSDIKNQDLKEEDQVSTSESKASIPPFQSLRNIIVAANTMALFISKEKASSRSAILKIMKQQKFSLLSERNQREIDEILKQSPRGLNSLDEAGRQNRSSIKEINTTNQLNRREIYVVRYENNALIENWLESFVWSVIFTQHFETKLFRAEKVKLFYVEIKDN